MASQETLDLFDELYYKTYSDVLKYVICHCSNMEDVKDIVQNIYLDVLKRLKRNDFPIYPAYIMGIAKNKVRDYYRLNYKVKIISLFLKIKDQGEVSLIDTIPSEINIESQIIRKENIQLISKYLKKKKVIIFQIFYLYYDQDYSIKEIANELQISESNVKNYLYRTLNELNTLMKDGGEWDVSKTNNKKSIWRWV